jgi:hypothetical protein
MTGLNTAALVDEIASTAMQLGLFEKVNIHEPKSQPGNGMTAAVWVEQIQPIAQASGLNSTSVLVLFTFRIYQSAFAEPQDMIDPNVMRAVDTLLEQYSANFTLSGTVREIDLLGEFGTPLSAQAGWLNVDGKIFRIMDVNLPVLINDVWTQVS